MRTYSCPRLLLVVLSLLCLRMSGAEPSATVPVGVARIDITPALPIRLSGYQSRATEANEIQTPLYARALAIGADEQTPVVLITAEIIGISEQLSDAIAAALRAKHPRLARANVAIATTHVHTGPAIAGVLPFMYSADLPPEQVQRIERYTAGLQAKLVQVGLDALAARRPAQLGWNKGRVTFATQRRTVVDGKWKNFGVVPEGPADHALPVLRAADAQGGVRAVLLNYACHCTTLGGNHNYVHSDWAGDAAQRLEAAHPGAVALVAIGCGADANPNPRGAPEAVLAHGQSVAAEAQRLLAGPMRTLGAVSAVTYERIELPLDRAVTREELQARAAPAQKQTSRYAATRHLATLDAGKPLPRAIPYPIQTWRFGDALALVFLSGEVVSEYSLRLKRELDGTRLWVNAYSNSVPSYIPSKRMYPEGGYEVDGSMDYYGWPTRLAIDTEDRVIAAVRAQLPASWRK